MALCTPEELSRRLALRKADFRWRGESRGSRHPPGVRADADLVGQLAVPGGLRSGDRRDDDREPRSERRGVPRLLAHGDEPGGSAPEPQGRAAAGRALSPERLRQHRPRRAAGADGRDDRRRQPQRHELPRARRRVRAPLPARADHGGGRGHRRQGRSQQAAGRAGRPRHVPARRRAHRRRHRGARSQGAHVGLGRRGGADRDPDPRDAQRGRPTTRSRSRSPSTRRGSRWSLAPSTPAATASGRRRSPRTTSSPRRSPSSTTCSCPTSGSS